mmetsp:Transcript_8131/g.20396  ORF Transcript_8131/g.20396 Transcript_8131/m.20396 type:complete len:203 (+) Transcript_8131:1972-2580(+)
MTGVILTSPNPSMTYLSSISLEGCKSTARLVYGSHVPRTHRPESSGLLKPPLSPVGSSQAKAGPIIPPLDSIVASCSFVLRFSSTGVSSRSKPGEVRSRNFAPNTIPACHGVLARMFSPILWMESGWLLPNMSGPGAPLVSAKTRRSGRPYHGIVLVSDEGGVPSSDPSGSGTTTKTSTPNAAWAHRFPMVENKFSGSNGTT